MVSTPDLVVAKTALTATLIRADPNALHRGDVARFLELLDNTLDECSRPNVQKCKNWIIANVVPSGRRAATLGKYLVALSESMDIDFDRPSVMRRRLHVLFIASDVLHHVITRQRNDELARSWDSHLPAMVATASTFEKCPKHLTKVRNLISLWEEREYLHAAFITRLRDSFAQASDKNSGTRIQISKEALKLAKEAPYTMPSSHGDPSTAWNHLPATSWLVQLAPDSTRPVRRDYLRPSQLTPGRLQEDLINRVKSALSDVEALFQDEHVREKTGADFNLLGEVQKQGDSADDAASIDTYWGWSRPLCHRTKQRRRTAASNPPPARRSRSGSRSPSRLSSANRSRRSPKRFKYSSRSQSRDKSRSPGRRNSSSGLHHRGSCRDRQRTSSRRSYTNSMSRPSSRSSTRSGSGPPCHRPSPSPSSYNDSDRRGVQQPPNPHAPHGFPAMPQGPGGFPVPPPPPPVGYQGIFPPPPPPPPQGWNPNQSGFVPPPIMGGGWGAGPVPPPPPPQSSPYDAQQQYGGRGSGWSGGGGRGYRGRGRGGNGRGGYGYGYGYGGYGSR
ncbi:RNA polymerase II-binding domain-containing protein [Hirsutella rhossiliensis]|uniref:RNA polymerase II-binding domain-containing protein n=1 Tax=Hirsutella rhossiliensis TaxID=111463 RepID=A0A9P8N7G1_9HYPO|nr:RNA polymerase II-binding domain-containing protein [Hirsutella rhossiliensis]KAH0967942.1 RNA polymerase II-binding domain-containing protein [Hirsutella rhossiliensis]